MVLAAQALTGYFDDTRSTPLTNEPASDSVVVTITRVTAAWKDSGTTGLDASKSKYGPGDPTDWRLYLNGSGKPLASQNGRPCRFEFQYRSDDFIRRAHATNSASSNVLSSLDVQDIALIPDLDFVPIREEDNVERAKISAAYKRQ